MRSKWLTHRYGMDLHAARPVAGVARRRGCSSFRKPSEDSQRLDMGNTFGSYDGWEPWYEMHDADLVKLERLLAKHGSHWINHANERGDTLIHAAAKSGQRDRCEFLLRHGSQHSPTSLCGTPAQVADAAGHKELAEWLHQTQPAVLFLDIDGVLNSQESRRAGDDQRVPGQKLYMSQLPTEAMLANLAHVARAAGPLRICLSSTWRCSPDTRAAVVEALRSVGLALAGDTPDFETICQGDRVDEIIHALWEHSARGYDTLPWVVLDDMDLLAMNSKLDSASFVRIDDAVGLTRAKADEVIAKLQAKRAVLRQHNFFVSGCPAADHPWVSPWSFRLGSTKVHQSSV